MNTNRCHELKNLSVAEKLVPGEALIVRAESEASASFITEAQRAELRARLAYHRVHPEEPGVTVAQLKAKLLTTSHRA